MLGRRWLGFFPGAGHPGRCWPIERFAQLADFLIRNDRLRPVIFVGPEERQMISEIRALFPRRASYSTNFRYPNWRRLQARLAVFISNDTGPVHIAAAVGNAGSSVD